MQYFILGAPRVPGLVVLLLPYKERKLLLGHNPYFQTQTFSVVVQPMTRQDSRGPESSLKIDIRLETCLPSVALRTVTDLSQSSNPDQVHLPGQF